MVRMQKNMSMRKSVDDNGTSDCDTVLEKGGGEAYSDSDNAEAVDKEHSEQHGNDADSKEDANEMKAREDSLSDLSDVLRPMDIRSPKRVCKRSWAVFRPEDEFSVKTICIFAGSVLRRVQLEEKARKAKNSTKRFREL